VITEKTKDYATGLTDTIITSGVYGCLNFLPVLLFCFLVFIFLLLLCPDSPFT